MPDKRTYADRREYNKAAVTARRRKLRKMAIDHAGGSCWICGYSKSIRALTFHHLDPSKKDFGLSDRGLTRSWAKTLNEIDKCALLCANCHAEVHDGIVRVPNKKVHR